MFNAITVVLLIVLPGAAIVFVWGALGCVWRLGVDKLSTQLAFAEFDTRCKTEVKGMREIEKGGEGG